MKLPIFAEGQVWLDKGVVVDWHTTVILEIIMPEGRDDDE